jgi:hypothetical protein
MTRGADRDWEAGIRELHAEAGVLRLTLVTAADAIALIASAQADDSYALACLRALDTYRRRIGRPATDPPGCLTCGRRLGADTPLLALIIPDRDDASQCLAIGLCASCAGRHRDRAGLEAAIIGALRRMLWPDLRTIAPPAGAVGRA